MNKSLRQIAIENAIESWTDKLNGVYQWWEIKRYDKEYCQTQIDYFKNKLNAEI